MSTYDLEEQEQLAALKAWWKENGGAILLGATLVLAAIAAWNGWMWYQRSQSAQAAVRAEQMPRRIPRGARMSRNRPVRAEGCSRGKRRSSTTARITGRSSYHQQANRHGWK